MSESVPLDSNIIRKGLKTIGIHPITLNHTFLELDVTKSNLNDIKEISKFPNLMYIDISDNQIEDLAVLKDVSILVQLKAR